MLGYGIDCRDSLRPGSDGTNTYDSIWQHSDGMAIVGIASDRSLPVCSRSCCSWSTCLGRGSQANFLGGSRVFLCSSVIEEGISAAGVPGSRSGG